jgi:Nucleoside-diphosphate-sugar pyrophosphorylase involved in lipopolysaccharide biosynthesis/translation initiation factor 2B, gamma/epsilon subunits (eIF-2Bgamma/eIF-2Bepsilon)
MIVTILAGGEGTRLRPLTLTKPKPLIKVLNIPVLTYTLENLRKMNIREAYLTLHYQANKIIATYGSEYKGIELKYSIEDRPLGTAGSVNFAVGNYNERTLVLSGDLLIDFNLKEIIDFHSKKGSIFTIASTRVKNPYQFGIIKTNEEGRVIKFLEKPSPSEVFSNIINAGIYVIEPEVFKYIPKGIEFDFSKDLIPILLSKNEPVYSIELDGYWRDIGTLEQYLETNKELLEGYSRNLLNIALDLQEIRKEEGYKGPNFISSSALIQPKARVGPYVIVDSDTVIKEGSIISFSILGKACYVGERCIISSSIMGDNVKLKGGILIFDGCTIGDNTIIGKGVEIRSFVKIWPNRIIENNLIVSSDIITGTKYVKRIFINGLASFIPNLEISPELSSKIGKALSSFIQLRSSIFVGKDNHSYSKIVEQSLISGILSCGCNVINSRPVTPNIARAITRSLKANSGVIISSHPKDEDIITIQVLDNNGANINLKHEKKLEEILQREDFRTLDYKNIGDISFFPSVFDIYFSEILNIFDPSYISDNIKLALDINGCFLQEFINLILRNYKLNKYIIFDSNYKKIEEENLSYILSNFKNLNIDFGFIFDKNLIHYSTVINNGYLLNPIQNFLLQIFCAYENGFNIINIPPYIPSSLMDYIEKIGFKIRIFPLNYRDFSRSLLEAKSVTIDCENRFGANPICGPDSILALLNLIFFISKTNKSLVKIIKDFPEYYITNTILECSSEEIFYLFENLKSNNEMKIYPYYNGLSVNFDEADCFIQPSQHYLGIDIYSISRSYETSLKYLTILRKIIQNLIKHSK